MRNKRMLAVGVAAGAVVAATTVSMWPAEAETNGSAAPAAAGDYVLAGAGDIAKCTYNKTTGVYTPAPGNVASKNVLDNALSGANGTIFTAGDNAQDVGAVTEYENCLSLTWGQYKGMIMPAPGNHDYMGSKAQNYKSYYETNTAPSGEPSNAVNVGYNSNDKYFAYRYDLGTNWRIFSLDSYVCSNEAKQYDSSIDANACARQAAWLRDELKTTSATCIGAYWHHPRFTTTSGKGHKSDAGLDPLYRALYDRGADFVVNGHNHFYEQYAEQNPDGGAAADGVREFIVGTGGASQDSFSTTVASNRAAYNDQTFGVLKLTLGANGGYSWQFMSTDASKLGTGSNGSGSDSHTSARATFSGSEQTCNPKKAMQ